MGSAQLPRGRGTHVRPLSRLKINEAHVPPVPTRFGIVIFPAFQAMDVFGALDSLNVLSWTYPSHRLAVIADTLEPVSTGNRSVPDYPFAQSIVPTHTFTTAPPLDVLIVPGGMGTRNITDDIQRAIDFIRDTYPSLQYLITICTGARLAALSGRLDNHSATTNKLAWASTTALGPRTHWKARARWVQDGKVWSSSGITAGIDVTFAWIAHVYGDTTAQLLADEMEYERRTNPDDDPFACLNGCTDVPPVKQEL